MRIATDDLKRFAPHGKVSILQGIGSSNDLFDTYQINTPLRVCHFLAQIVHESDGFRTTTEYASGAAYEGRHDLGNTEIGDGKRFKGRGLMQVTGRKNYISFTDWQGGQPDFVDHPEKVAEFPWALLGAIWFWDKHNLNHLADKNDLRGITRVVNGGTNGLIDRQVWFKRAWEIWGRFEDIKYAGAGKPLLSSRLVASGGVLGTMSLANAAEMSGYFSTLWQNIHQFLDDVPFLKPVLFGVVLLAAGWVFYHRWRQSREYES